MANEIERKFLVVAVPDSVELGPGELQQGYLAVDWPIEVRVRRTAHDPGRHCCVVGS